MKLLGVGLYTYSEASKLTRIPTSVIRRWLIGYRAKPHTSDGPRMIPPIWKCELGNEDLEGITFRDLLEVRFVNAFRKYGVSLQAIRFASDYARRILENPYPFTSRRFKTDGQSIFLEALETVGEAHLLNLNRQQYAFHKIIEPSLYSGIEFDEDDLAIRWFPIPKSKEIVIDPKRAFGKPILNKYGLRTSVLYDSYRVEGSKNEVAANFEIPVEAVNAAIEFEEHCQT